MTSATIVVCGLLLAGACSAQNAIDKIVGTWKAVPEESLPRSQNTANVTWTFTKIGPSTIRRTSESVDKSGVTHTSELTETCDGKEHHTEGAPEGQSWICQPDTYNFIGKRNGNVVLEVKTTFSNDGRTMTYHRKVLDAKGNWTEDTKVWRKQ